MPNCTSNGNTQQLLMHVKMTYTSKLSIFIGTRSFNLGLQNFFLWKKLSSFYLVLEAGSLKCDEKECAHLTHSQLNSN